MTDEELLAELAQLALAARHEKGQDRKQATEEMGVSYRTLGAFEKIENTKLPAKSSRRAIEQHYGWRIGVIEDIWKRRREIDPGTLTMEDLLPPENRGVLEARHLTDDQLINELTFRLIMKQ